MTSISTHSGERAESYCGFRNVDGGKVASVSTHSKWYKVAWIRVRITNKNNDFKLYFVLPYFYGHIMLTSDQPVVLMVRNL